MPAPIHPQPGEKRIRNVQARNRNTGARYDVTLVRFTDHGFLVIHECGEVDEMPYREWALVEADPAVILSTPGAL